MPTHNVDVVNNGVAANTNKRILPVCVLQIECYCAVI